MENKQFLLFHISEFYPSGGLGDIKETFNDLQSGIKYAKEHNILIESYIYDRINDVFYGLEDEKYD